MVRASEYRLRVYHERAREYKEFKIRESNEGQGVQKVLRSGVVE